MRLIFVPIMFAVAMNAASISQAAEQVTSCDLFRKRFSEAPRVLSLRLPSSKLYREPPRYGGEVWKTEPTRADDGELWYTTGVYCHGDKLHMVVSDIDRPGGADHPTFDLIAAGIYALTGWDADRVVHTTDEIIKNRPRGLGDIKTTELMPGAYASIDFTIFEIDLD
jgi:hypothetical protein